MTNLLENKLLLRKEKGTLRSLSCFDGLIDFYSNDYLGLAQLSSKSMVKSHGATGSRLISGTSELHLKAERCLAECFDSQNALIFNSGYDANIGLFSTIPQKEDIVLYDSLIHASIRDGIRLGLAKSYSFKHNDLTDLENRLLKFKDRVIYVAVESVYSMDGDTIDLKSISDLCEKYGARLIVDEAHSAGYIGPNGSGTCVDLDIQNTVFARVVTFGKAFGSHGAVVLSSNLVIDYLVNFCRSFIYTTALPESTMERLIWSVELNKKQRIEKLKFNIDLFLSTVVNSDRTNTSPIQVVQVGCVAKAKQIADELQVNGFAVKPIFSPTVQEGKERIRICIHSFNTESDIKKLSNIINSFF